MSGLLTTARRRAAERNKWSKSVRSRIESATGTKCLVIEGAISEDDLGKLRDLVSDLELSRVDLTRVRHIDLYGFQILISAVRSFGEAGRRLEIAAGSQIEELSHRAGLGAWLTSATGSRTERQAT